MKKKIKEKRCEVIERVQARASIRKLLRGRDLPSWYGSDSEQSPNRRSWH
ncbi:hypothetical protein [Brevibacillus parabrevis]|nr:hypothetical protein [Brevibacillus parabrevis]